MFQKSIKREKSVAKRRWRRASVPREQPQTLPSLMSRKTGTHSGINGNGVRGFIAHKPRKSTLLFPKYLLGRRGMAKARQGSWYTGLGSSWQDARGKERDYWEAECPCPITSNGAGLGATKTRQDPQLERGLTPEL